MGVGMVAFAAIQVFDLEAVAAAAAGCPQANQHSVCAHTDLISNRPMGLALCWSQFADVLDYSKGSAGYFEIYITGIYV